MKVRITCDECGTTREFECDGIYVLALNPKDGGPMSEVHNIDPRQVMAITAQWFFDYMRRSSQGKYTVFPLPEMKENDEAQQIHFQDFLKGQGFDIDKMRKEGEEPDGKQG